MFAGRSSIGLLPGGRRSGAMDRFAWLCAWSGAIAVLVLARGLSPAIAGLGTHTQLGLAPCALLLSTGLPCPACGMTTSFAHMAHLQPWRACQANAAGVPGFVMVLIVALVAPVGLYRRWPFGGALRRIHADRIAVALSLWVGVVWLARVLFRFLA